MTHLRSLKGSQINGRLRKAFDVEVASGVVGHKEEVSLPRHTKLWAIANSYQLINYYLSTVYLPTKDLKNLLSIG